MEDFKNLHLGKTNEIKATEKFYPHLQNWILEAAQEFEAILYFKRSKE